MNIKAFDEGLQLGIEASRKDNSQKGHGSLFKIILPKGH